MGNFFLHVDGNFSVITILFHTLIITQFLMPSKVTVNAGSFHFSKEESYGRESSVTAYDVSNLHIYLP